MSTMAQLYDNAPSAAIEIEGYEEDYRDDGSEGMMRFVVDAVDKDEFLTTVAGLPETITIFGTTVTRLIPLIHPYIFNCWADSIHLYPPPGLPAVQTGAGGIGFPFYFADVHFSTPKYQTTGDSPTVTIARRPAVDMVTRPGSAYYFPSDGRRINHDVGVPVLKVAYTYTFHRLGSLNNDLFDSLTGCVNLTSFLGKDPGTVLYLGCSSTGQFSVGGNPSYEADQDFEFRAIPHNKIMRDDGSDFEAPVQVGDSSKFLLPQAELNALLY